MSCMFLHIITLKIKDMNSDWIRSWSLSWIMNASGWEMCGDWRSDAHPIHCGLSGTDASCMLWWCNSMEDHATDFNSFPFLSSSNFSLGSKPENSISIWSICTLDGCPYWRGSLFCWPSPSSGFMLTCSRSAAPTSTAPSAPKSTAALTVPTSSPLLPGTHPAHLVSLVPL